MYPALKTVNPAGTVGLASSDASLLFIVGIGDWLCWPAAMLLCVYVLYCIPLGCSIVTAS